MNTPTAKQRSSCTVGGGQQQLEQGVDNRAHPGGGPGVGPGTLKTSKPYCDDDKRLQKPPSQDPGATSVGGGGPRMLGSDLRATPVGGGGPRVLRSSSPGPGLEESLRCPGPGFEENLCGRELGSTDGGSRGYEKVKLHGRKSRMWARSQQMSTSEGSSSYFVIPMKYEVWRPSQEAWHAEEGLVPKDGENSIRVEVALSRRAKIQDEFEEPKEVCFTRKQRRMLEKEMKKRVGVSEVYSPPRVAAEAQKQGFRKGTSFDLITGWDLQDGAQRKSMWKRLKEENPWLIVLSPPCTAFSSLQEWNLPRMREGAAIHMVKVGLEHLELAAAIMKWQCNRGGYALFEHPRNAKSWHEECLRSLMEEPGMRKVECDMCAFGLKVVPEGFSRKPTTLLTNSEEIAKQVGRKCNGRHFHVPLLHGLAKKAQQYTPQFCKAIVCGLKRQIVVDQELPGQEGVSLDGQRHFIGEEIQGEEMPEGDLEEALDREVELGGAGVHQGEGQGSCAVTPEEKAAVLKLHKNTGHPQKTELIRFMRAARVKHEVIRWAHREFRCETCEAKAHPKVARPATIPRSYKPNQVLGMDLIFIPEVGGEKGTFPALSIVDWGTNFQVVQRLTGKFPSEVWQTFESYWGRIFGHPEVIITDPGREFLSEFMQSATAAGIVVHQTAARAPWQQGKTERHGAHFKEILEKARLEALVTSEEELEMLMRQVEQAKNRYSNRSGFSPVQRQIGQWPRIPAEIASDDVVDPQLVGGMMVDEMERLLEMRRVAQKAFCEHNARVTISRALRSRTRTWQEYKPGDLIFVYRVPKGRKRKVRSRGRV